jgi:hypothetical protein
MNQLSCAAARLSAALLIVSAAAVVLPVARVSACTCDGDWSARQYMDRADVVFLGRVERVRPASAGFWGSRHTATFSVQRLWKGPATNAIEVSAETSSPSCGVDFPAAEVLLVYAYRSGDGLETNSCSGNKPLSEVTAYLAALGSGYPPPPTDSAAQNDDTGDATGLILAGGAFLIVLLAAGAGWFVLRVRRSGNDTAGPLS